MHYDKIVLGCYAAIAVCLAAPLAGCGSPDANANGRLAVHEVFSDCAGVQDVTEFEGRSLASLENELGESDMESRFRLSSGVPEFRSELVNQFPVASNADREFVEQTWSASHCNLTVWSSEVDGEMVSVNTVRYNDTAVF